MKTKRKASKKITRARGAGAAKSSTQKQPKPKLLAGGNPQIAKADGDAPVQAYIDALSGWKRDAVRRVDTLVTKTIPQANKAVRWNSPMYGITGQGWFLSVHTFTKYIKIAFFRGTSLKPLPPGDSKSKEMRYVHIHEDGELDEVQFKGWLKQASRLPGWGKN